MYCPGLFDSGGGGSGSPYIGNRSSFVKADTVGGQQQQQHASTATVPPPQSDGLCMLLDKKMINSNPASYSSEVSPLVGAYRPPPHHFMQTPSAAAAAAAAAAYRSQATAAAAEMMAAAAPPPPYPATALAEPHLATLENFNPNLMHKQSLLDPAGPYGMTPLSPFATHHPPYPPHYMTAFNHHDYKPNFQPNNLLYQPPPPAGPYHYQEPYLTDYHRPVDPAKLYGLHSSSFSEHLKKLRESFQSKSAKCLNCSDPHKSSSNLLSTDDDKSRLNHRSPGDTANNGTNHRTTSSHDQHNGNNNNETAGNCSSRSSSTSGANHKAQVWNPVVDNSKDELKPPNEKVSTTGVKPLMKSEPASESEHSISRSHSTSTTDCGGQSSDESRRTPVKIESKCDELLHPDQNKSTNDKTIKVEQIDSTMVNDDTTKQPADKHDNSKTTKKSGSNSRRRRFRSGMDMIRPSRKRNQSKSCKKEKAKETVISSKNGRSKGSKRLVVNKSLGETLLHRSARNNRLEVVKHCLESGIYDVNARDNAGYTPLHECSSRGHIEVARLLLQHSADVNASATGGIRPLHDAIENNNIELVRLLLSYGADPNISTYSGLTPIQLCRSKSMSNFLKGFYDDITSDRRSFPAASLAWKFKTNITGLGYDVFDDVPTDDEAGEEMIIEFSDNPLLPLYSIQHQPNSNFYLLSDVLQALQLNHKHFTFKYPDVQISKVNEIEVKKIVPNQLERRERFECQGDPVDVVYKDERIDTLLGVQSIVIK